MVNVATLLADQVDGRVSIELSPALAHDSKALIGNAQTLAALCKDAHVPKSKILYRYLCA